VQEVDHPALGRIRTLGSPLKLSATRTAPPRPAPGLGEHTSAVLREHGFRDAEIAALRGAAAIAPRDT
jgi:crotonobetainyl-CoA:carnitine CoA-transferase CaiB-like acyl-CoA transferase